MEMISALPTGTVTFLFTDIEGSTQLLHRLGKTYGSVLAEHQSILRDAFKKFNGREIDTQGDAFFAAFARAVDAVNAVITAQRALASHSWGDGATVRVRMALHTGEPYLSPTGYVGLDVHRAARICSAGHGGQILLSQTTASLVRNDLAPGLGLRDLGEHRLKDLQHPEHLFQLVSSDLPSDFPALKSLDALPNNLPIQLSSFIGREYELGEIRQRLSATRLLTLTGVGGTGKTRLALQAGADVIQEFKDGVWLIELAPLSAPDLVPQAIALGLNLREQAGRPFLDLIQDYLARKNLLLVLDNCEHLVETCAQTADTLLRAAPRLKIVATSREALGIAGETTYPVPSLSLPTTAALLPDALSQYEAVQLFVERALAVQPNFQVTHQNAPAVAQICNRLDGIPLALELAAARTKALSVEQIAARLDDRFRLLTGGSRTALPRQRTLQAAIDWSYKLLSRPEQALLRRVSVFAGGWSLEAAEYVCAIEELESSDVLDPLLSLVDKSLVVADAQGTETRYHLLETIRQYAQEKLDTTEETVALRDRHLEYFRDLANKAKRAGRGADQLEWLERLNTEHDNMRAALTWSSEEGSVDAGLYLAASLWVFWVYYGHMKEGRVFLERLLGDPRAADHIEARASASLSAGILAHNLSNRSACQSHLEQSVMLWEQLGPAGAKDLMYARGWLLFTNAELEGSDYSLADQHFQDSLKYYRKMGGPAEIGDTLQTIGILAARRGDPVRARQATAESLAIFQTTGNQIRVNDLKSNLAYSEFEQGNYEQARLLSEQALNFYRNARFKYLIGDAQALQGAIAMREADYAAAKKWYSECVLDEQAVGGIAHIPECLIGFAGIAAAEQSFQRAAILLGAAQAQVEGRRVAFENFDRVELERLSGVSRSELGDSLFTQAQAKGRALTIEQAIELAFQEQ